MKSNNKTLKRREKMINSKLLWSILLSKNVKMVFGVPSSSIDGILNYIPTQIQWVSTGQELQNGFISQVYGSYTNNVGILFVGTGPGIATAISAIKNAECENKPLLVITTCYKKHKIDFQYWDVEKISKTIIKYTYHIKKSSEMKDTILLAYETAKIRNTSVILIIDEDILSETRTTLSISKKLDMNDTSSSYINKTKSDLLKINNTKLLVVISTTNNRTDYNIIHDFIKKNNLPYVTTWKARTIYNSGLYCGRIGSLGNHSANYALYNCDNILIIGNIIEDLQYNDKEYHYAMFSIPFITKNKNIYIINYKTNNILKNTKLYIYPYLNTILNKLHLRANDDWMERLQKSTPILLLDLPRKTLLEKYAYIAAQVYAKNKLNIPVTTGVGNHWYAIGKYINMTRPNCWESDTNWASIGVGMAHGIGLYYATKKPVWVFEGDGGACFSANNLFYLLNHVDLPLTITLYINNIYAAITSSYIIKGFDNDTRTYKVENIPLKMLPNCHIFDDTEKYFEYLNKNPVSTKLRFIIINLGIKEENSNVYEINMNKNYENYLKNSMFNEIINEPFVLSTSN
jgi:thiamine pyrophosphate-dependent acetolactate synthase large subunit-like protein